VEVIPVDEAKVKVLMETTLFLPLYLSSTLKKAGTTKRKPCVLFFLTPRKRRLNDVSYLIFIL